MSRIGKFFADRSEPKARSTLPLAFDDWLRYAGQYQPLFNQSITGNEERISVSYPGVVGGAYKANPTVFAVEGVRMRLFSEAKFRFREVVRGRPGNLFGHPELAVLEEPWEGGVTGDLLARMILSADFGGDAFVHRQGETLQVLRPDWTTIVTGSRTDRDMTGWDLGAELVGYLYQPGGPASGNDPIALRPEEVAHFAPNPDPLTPGRGMPWIMPVIREIEGDQAATTHKRQLFEKGGTPNIVVNFGGELTRDLFDGYVQAIKDEHEGVENAYKWLFLNTPTDVQTVGANLQQLDFSNVQGKGETRIAAAAGVHPVVAALSEGLQGASLNAGNFASARRIVADVTLRPLWRNAAGSLERIVQIPQSRAGRAELWYEEDGIGFLREDEKDRAEIQKLEAEAINTLVTAGFEPSSVVDAVTAGDLERLAHTGLFSVQLQEAGAEQPALPESPALQAIEGEG